MRDSNKELQKCQGQRSELGDSISGVGDISTGVGDNSSEVGDSISGVGRAHSTVTPLQLVSTQHSDTAAARAHTAQWQQLVSTQRSGSSSRAHHSDTAAAREHTSQ